MLPAYESNWYGIDQIATIVEEPPRTLRRRLAAAPENCKRLGETDSRGRPPVLYHFTSHPRLMLYHREHTLASQDPAPESCNPVNSAPSVPRSTAIAADDLATAQLRLMAIQEYEIRLRSMSKERAAYLTWREWQAAPKHLDVSISERLDGGHTRPRKRQIVLANWKPNTLRAWHRSLYIEGNRIPDAQALAALAPERKGASGRRAVEIPQELLDLVFAMSASTARADVAKAVEIAKPLWPSAFPTVSLSTWRRRVRELDPRKARKSLSHSIKRFRSEQSGDIETDWLELGYNALFLVDDVQMDWTGFSSDLQRTLRPYAYAVIRASTRQWIAFVASETPITQEQVRGLIGFAMQSTHGGIPGEIKFEHGAVACDPHMQWLLEALGVKVSRTSMDAGAVHAGAIPDSGQGHPQGKAIIESNGRRLHNEMWSMPGQVGTEERHTEPVRQDRMIEIARQAAAAGKPVMLPTAQQWPRLMAEAMHRNNSRAHSGLPETVDPDTGKKRYLSPDEYAAAKFSNVEILTMPETYLPLFYARGERVPVTRNGIIINRRCYGRFDQDLKRFQTVLAYQNEATPDACYVHELGRLCERYDKQRYGQAGQLEAKRSDEAVYRNQYREAMASAINTLANGSVVAVDSVRIVSGSVSPLSRPLAIPILDEQAASMRAAVARAESETKATVSRTAPLRSDPVPDSEIGNRQSAISPRRSLLSTASRFSSLVGSARPVPCAEEQTTEVNP